MSRRCESTTSPLGISRPCRGSSLGCLRIRLEAKSSRLREPRPALPRRSPVASRLSGRVCPCTGSLKGGFSPSLSSFECLMAGQRRRSFARPCFSPRGSKRLRSRNARPRAGLTTPPTAFPSTALSPAYAKPKKPSPLARERPSIRSSLIMEAPASDRRPSDGRYQ